MGSHPITRAAVDDAIRYADRWLAFRQRATRVPGVQAAVWFDGELVLSTAHGVADEASGEALTAAHRFRIASHSKTMTATVLAQMVEEGHLRLDDPIGTRLDWLHDSDSPVADLTLFQLLAHAGGIPRDSASSAHWQHEAPFLDADTLAERVLAEGTVTGADVRFKYSNIGYALLGQVIEAVTGRSWAEEVQERILDPLRLADTGPDWTPDVDGPWATGHTGLAWADRRVPIDQVPTNAMAAATGVWSTAADLAPTWRPTCRATNASSRMRRSAACNDPSSRSRGCPMAATGWDSSPRESPDAAGSATTVGGPATSPARSPCPRTGWSCRC